MPPCAVVCAFPRHVLPLRDAVKHACQRATHVRIAGIARQAGSCYDLMDIAIVVGRVQLTPESRLVMGAFLAASLLMSVRAAAADALQIYAAGSLTAAFTDIVKAFPAAEGTVAAPVFGPPGVLREKIEHGDRVDLLASADMEQPRTLARTRPGTFVVMFTRNRLCALGRAKRGPDIR